MAKKNSLVNSCNELISDLNKKIYKPIYVLVGDETYYIDVISDYIEQNVLSESEKAFNQTILYGKDTNVGAIIEISRRFPMMANQQVVIVKEAQLIKKLEDLEVYVKAPQPSTILVLCLKQNPGVKTGEKVKKLFTQIAKIGVVFESKRLYDYQIPEWITSYLTKTGISISPESAELLKDFLGNDLSKVVNELDKLSITLPEGTKRITTDHIEQNIGISKDFNRFELNNAVSNRDVVKANRIVDYFAKNPGPNPMVLTTSTLFQHFNKIFTYHFLKDKSERAVALELGINPFFVKDYVRAAKFYNPKKCVEVFSLLREYDMRSKGVNNDSVNAGELLRELVFKIIH